MSTYLQHFTERFATLGAHNLELLGDLYSEDVTFRDPLHHINGLTALRGYFAQLYANVDEVRYSFEGLDEPQPGHGSRPARMPISRNPHCACPPARPSSTAASPRAISTCARSCCRAVKPAWYPAA